MAYKVIIISGRTYDEADWVEIIRSTTQMGARRKATNWIHKNICESDYTKIEKWNDDLVDWWYLRSE